jgi:hypothetical protein
MEKQFYGFKRGSKHQAPSKENDLEALMKTFILGGLHREIDDRTVPGKGGKVPVDVVAKGASALLNLKPSESLVKRWMASRSFERSTKEVF